MSRFAKLIESASQNEESVEETTVVASSRFGAEENFNITETGPYTENKYKVLMRVCCGDNCEQPLLHVIDPVYDFDVGQTQSIPLEIVFTELTPEVKEDPDGSVMGVWSKHHLTSEKYYLFTCPECGEEDTYPICTDGGILILTVDAVETEARIPQNRIAFRNRPKAGWVTKDS